MPLPPIDPATGLTLDFDHSMAKWGQHRGAPLPAVGNVL
jgi:hypothetical protein